MSKFNQMLVTSGPDLIAARAEKRTTETKECFEAEKLATEKAIRELQLKITEMEDLAVHSTDQLVVGESLNPEKWTKERIDLALQLNDLKVELNVIDELMKEYFED